MDSQQDDSTISLTENKENKENKEYLEKLNQYYSLKKNYETKKQEKKMRILRNDNLSMRQKQEAYSKLKMNCFNCGRRVGTIFKNEDGVLYHQLIMGIYHGTRYLINDYSKTNPYPAAKAINTKRNSCDFLEKID